MGSLQKPLPMTLQTSSPGPKIKWRRATFRRRFEHWLSVLDNGWTWEFTYKGRTFPTVPGGITLNTIISILATVSKSRLIFTVSAVLGQLKWDWYEKRTDTLNHFETFDEASRGPLGATRLLLGRRAFLSIASVGALTTILALAMGPFVQQVVGYSEKGSFVDSDDVWTQKMTKPSYMSYGDSDLDYVAALNGAFWNDIRLYDRRPHCPSGNCHIDIFATLEFCVFSGIVEDVSSMQWDCEAGFDKAVFEALHKEWIRTGDSKPIVKNCSIFFGPVSLIPFKAALNSQSMRIRNGGYGRQSISLRR
ncbi:hypothetical protein QBC35DRAFT_466591 [Podospora australis]|uniref:Uncharacterized protein n=1 Tax=Podospora australis TaxID=1536484 RepID=A0AAN6WLE5_9PEZI|nr:hypothetical protein QBC35DRAFT_466591 [Podospora australis]